MPNRLKEIAHEIREKDKVHYLVKKQERSILRSLDDAAAWFGDSAQRAPLLTICSVGYRGRYCLDWNARLTGYLNSRKTDRYTWLVLDNNQRPDEKMDPRDNHFTIIPGPECNAIGGYGHAQGLTKLLPHVKTRFVLFLDPDCFIVKKNWIDDVLQHMLGNDLAFFGTPIVPWRFNSYRYFPWATCMFVDLAKVPISTLEFTPGIWRWWVNVTYRAIGKLSKSAPSPLLRYMFYCLLTGNWLSTGYRIHRRYAFHRHLQNECAIPYWDVAQPTGWRRRISCKVIPDRFSLFPKKPGYFSSVRFRDVGGYDVASSGWEEFVWKNQPFAFHVRSVSEANYRAYEDKLPEVVNWFMVA